MSAFNEYFQSTVDQRVVKIYGGAGTGKTSYLLTKIGEELERGVNISQIVFLGYTRASCQEALSRISKVLYKTEENALNSNEVPKGLWFHTIHALSLRLLMRTGFFKDYKIVNWKNRKDFCDSVGLKSPDYDEEIVSSEQISEGSAFYSIISYLVNTFRTPEQYRECDFTEDLHDKDFLDLYNRWLLYKSSKNLLDFDDLLTQMYKRSLTVYAKVLFVDEFQDCSPLQVAIIKRLMLGKERVYIAGDADQALYRFQGAEPELMLDFPVNDTVVLPQSYRCPRKVFNRAQYYISQNQRRYPAKILPKDAEGEYSVLLYPSIRDLSRLLKVYILYGKTYLLLRTNWLVSKLSWQLADEKILFRYLDKKKDGSFGWNDNKLSIINDVLSKGDYTEKLIRLNSIERNTKMSNGTYSFLSRYLYLTKPINPDSIKTFIGTIHSAKGREAETVLLFDDVTRRVLNGMNTDQGLEDERRIWYVGMTRAKERLVIVNNFFHDFSTVSLNLPIELRNIK